MSILSDIQAETFSFEPDRCPCVGILVMECGRLYCPICDTDYKEERMSNFICEKCGKEIVEGDDGHYITGCEHYPIESKEGNE